MKVQRGLAIAGSPARVGEFVELTKPRITFMVMVTAAAGFYLASIGRLDAALFLHTMLGTGLVAAGASCLNQIVERETDARMDVRRDGSNSCRRRCSARRSRCSARSSCCSR